MHKRITLLLASTLLIIALATVTQAQEADEQSDSEAGAELLQEVRQRLNNKAESLGDVSQDIGLIEEQLDLATERVLTLEQQITGLEAVLAESEAKLKVVQEAITELTIKIADKNDLVNEKREQLAEQQELAEDFLEFLYVQNVNIGGFDGRISQTLKLLFAEEQASDLLTDLYFLELMETASRELFIELDQTKRELEQEELELKQQKVLEQELERELIRTRDIRQIQLDAQAELLSQTQGRIEIYEQLLIEAQREKSEIRSQVSDLAANYRDLEERFGELGSNFATDDIGAGLGKAKLSWPIIPERGISAFFRDQSYKAALGVEHNAIDIRAGMETPVLAAADGVVYRVRGGEGPEYHYIIVAHKNGILTLYGHMYDIYVREGQTVRRGQRIGASGGLPGSRGAGWLTTGPHLHFEVFDNGRHVDPMYYLDLSQINSKFVPDRYLSLPR